MAVYTQTTEADVRVFLSDYTIGDLISLTGITEGVENTNYLIETTAGRFILTLFEKRVAEADLPYFMAAMAHANSNGVPAPLPVLSNDQKTIRELAGRPCAITTFLNGKADMSPDPEAAGKMGAFNARLHQSAKGFDRHRKNSLTLEDWRLLADKCRKNADKAAPGLSALIDDELNFLAENWPTDLPGGLVHADLYPDNVFFLNNEISGVIDFYFSCTDFFAYDLAITLNAWSSDKGVWRDNNAKALLLAYMQTRAISSAEKKAFPTLLRGAVMRILLTRLHDWLHQIEGAVVNVKDPLEYHQLLLHHRASIHMFEDITGS